MNYIVLFITIIVCISVPVIFTDWPTGEYVVTKTAAPLTKNQLGMLEVVALISYFAAIGVANCILVLFFAKWWAYSVVLIVMSVVYVIVIEELQFFGASPFDITLTLIFVFMNIICGTVCVGLGFWYMLEYNIRDGPQERQLALWLEKWSRDLAPDEYEQLVDLVKSPHTPVANIVGAHNVRRRVIAP